MYLLFPINNLSKQNCTISRGMRKPFEFKVSCYAVHMVKLNHKFSILYRAKESDKIRETELNENIFYIMPNCWIGKAYVNDFYFEYINNNQVMDTLDLM